MAPRLVNKNDLKNIFEINNSVQAFPWTMNAIEEEIANPYSTGWLIEDKVKVTGYIFVRKIDGAQEIMTLGVREGAQRTGIATTLLRHVLKGKSDLVLEVSENNHGAVTLYKKMGFEIFSRRKHYYPDGSSALCMKLNIANP